MNNYELINNERDCSSKLNVLVITLSKWRSFLLSSAYSEKIIRLQFRPNDESRLFLGIIGMRYTDLQFYQRKTLDTGHLYPIFRFFRSHVPSFLRAPKHRSSKRSSDFSPRLPFTSLRRSV